jgi:hypothetical protein
MTGDKHVKINHSDELIDTIRWASGGMSFEEYATATGLDKEYIFRILKGDIEKVDEDTRKKLSLKH